MTRQLGFALLAITAAIALPLAVSSQERPAPRVAVLPLGTIVAWHNLGQPTANPPAGWMLCDGGEITDAAYVATRGKGHRTPNLNGATGTDRTNAGRPAFLRGGVASPRDGYGGNDRHHHGIRHDHDLTHTHGIAHRHEMPHRHRVSLRTSRAGGNDRAGREGLGGTRGHSHDVRGQTEDASTTTSRSATPSRSEGARPPATATAKQLHSDQAEALPRHFRVTWIIKIR